MAGVALIGAVAFAAGAGARTLDVRAERVRNPSVQASHLELTLTEQTGDGTLSLTADEIDIPALSIAKARLDWHCALVRAEDGTRVCSGPATLAGKDGPVTASLRIEIAGDRAALGLEREGARARFVLPFGDDAPFGVTLGRIPVAWLRAPARSAWPNGELREGLVDAELSVRRDGSVDGRIGVDGLALNSLDGALSAEGLAASGQLHVEPGADGTRVRLDGGLEGGRLHFGDVRIALPDAPVGVVLDAASENDRRWRIATFDWSDGDTLSFAASGVFDVSSPDVLPDLAVEVRRATLPLAVERYGASLAAARGVALPKAEGGVSGDFAIVSGTPERIALSFDDASFAQASSFEVKGLDGSIDWRAHGEGAATHLRWKRIGVGGHVLGPAEARLRSRDGAIALASPLRLDLFGGTVRLDRLSVDPRSGGRLDASAHVAAKNLGYDSADGSIAAAGASFDADIITSGTLDAPRLDLDASFHGGEYLYGAFYVKLPATPVHARLSAQKTGPVWRVDRLAWNDPGVLDVEGSADLAPENASPLPVLTLDLREAALGPALDRYAKSWLASKGYGDLTASGKLSGAIAFDRGGLSRIAIDARRVSVDDGAGRFALAGIDGGIDWRVAGGAPPTSIAWSSIDLFRLPLGSGKAGFRTTDGNIVLADPIAVEVLGGKVRLERFAVQPRSPRGERYSASLAVAGIDMAKLSELLGWPRFGGNLSGGIPDIEWAGDTLELNGGLDLYVFDGYLGVSGMKLERPFGVAPSLEANIHFENFDLEQVTSAFSFGGMSGRLNGNVRDLRLVDWTPVAFDAALRSDGGGRMSYKAVNDLTALGGGGGLSSGLQTMALKLFDTFGYRRLGIRCRLQAEVCTMGGIEAAAGDAAAAAEASDRYTIVEGSGIPRIEIVGHRRSVDWPTLVRRLVEATKGQGPVIQ